MGYEEPDFEKADRNYTFNSEHAKTHAVLEYGDLSKPVSP
jgi:hypothetical protein